MRVRCLVTLLGLHFLLQGTLSGNPVPLPANQSRAAFFQWADTQTASPVANPQTSQQVDNVYPGTGNPGTDTPTHWLYSPEDYTFEKGATGDLRQISGGNGPLSELGARIPIILIHGWQGGEFFNGLTDPNDLRDVKYSPEVYWRNFIDFLYVEQRLTRSSIGTPRGFKVFVYKYPSYKHVTFNARKLKELIESVDELEGKELVFIAHSMGSLVTRSLFEEHGFPTSRLKRAILLDGPHHGSPAAIPGLVLLNTVAKNLGTPGSHDLQWANHDFIHGSQGGTVYEGRSMPTGTAYFSACFGLENNATYRYISDSHYNQVAAGERVAVSPNQIADYLRQSSGFYEASPFKTFPFRLNTFSPGFDDYFRNRIDATPESKRRVLPVFRERGDAHLRYQKLELGSGGFWTFRLPMIPNPWLTYLAIRHRDMPDAYRAKLFLYGGFDFDESSDFYTSTHNSSFAPLNTDSLMAIASNGVMALGFGAYPLGTKPNSAGEVFGYLNTGPVPTISSLMLTDRTFDQEVQSFSSRWPFLGGKNISGYLPQKAQLRGIYRFGSGDADYRGDGQSKHRYVVDFNHERFKSGGYSGEKLQFEYDDGTDVTLAQGAGTLPHPHNFHGWRLGSTPYEDERLRYLAGALDLTADGGWGMQENSGGSLLLPSTKQAMRDFIVSKELLERPLKHDPIFCSIARDLAYFDDVKIGQSGSQHIEEAALRGFVSGRSDLLFWPDGNLRRDEAATLLYRLGLRLGALPVPGRTTPFFSDVALGNAHFPAVQSLGSNGKINTSTGSYRPTDFETVGEFATKLVSIFELREKLKNQPKKFEGQSTNAVHSESMEILQANFAPRLHPLTGEVFEGQAEQIASMNLRSINDPITRGDAARWLVNTFQSLKDLDR